MNTEEKLRILSRDAQYDLSCACGTNDEDRRHRGERGMWVYPVTLPEGGKGIMLKTLLSNVCTNDCRYCPLRNNQDVHRCTLTPEETARVFMDYKRRLRLIGLFLTSGVCGSPDQTMEKLIATTEILRKKYHYRGYIHLKVIPGASDAALTKAVSLASAVSLNIETPTAEAFQHLSSTKNFMTDIVRPVRLISQLTAKGSPFAKVKQTTQFIVGASNESDRDLIFSTFRLYKRWNLNRVYFSAYQRGLGDPALPAESTPRLNPEQTLSREHRLYQSDFLMRQYQWDVNDIPLDPDGNLKLDTDPKQHWADLHPELFPLDIRRADKEHLLRIPGLGPTFVKRILKARKETHIRDLRDIGLRGKELHKVERYITGTAQLSLF